MNTQEILDKVQTMVDFVANKAKVLSATDRLKMSELSTELAKQVDCDVLVATAVIKMFVKANDKEFKISKGLKGGFQRVGAASTAPVKSKSKSVTQENSVESQVEEEVSDESEDVSEDNS